MLDGSTASKAAATDFADSPIAAARDVRSLGTVATRQPIFGVHRAGPTFGADWTFFLVFIDTCAILLRCCRTHADCSPRVFSWVNVRISQLRKPRKPKANRRPAQAAKIPGRRGKRCRPELRQTSVTNLTHPRPTLRTTGFALPDQHSAVAVLLLSFLAVAVTMVLAHSLRASPAHATTVLRTANSPPIRPVVSAASPTARQPEAIVLSHSLPPWPPAMPLIEVSHARTPGAAGAIVFPELGARGPVPVADPPEPQGDGLTASAQLRHSGRLDVMGSQGEQARRWIESTTCKFRDGASPGTLASRRPYMSQGAKCAPNATNFGRQLAAAARWQTEELVIYTARYQRIAYPMGDVAPLHGACTDVVIRAYRALGIDLQQLVHRAGVGSGDPNIDHRRTETLRRFFARYGEDLPVTAFPEDYRPGDIVTYYRPFSRVSRSHIAIVSDVLAPTRRPMIVHNRGWGPQLEDALFVDRITGHYRFTSKTKRVVAVTTMRPPAIALRPLREASSAFQALDSR
jgi:uncharacterized protein YijF (DUF1287 family)